MSDLFLIVLMSVMLLCLFVVLTESKLLAHVQRSFGPSMAGSNGWLQIVLDLVKLLNKEFFMFSSSGSNMVPFFMAMFYSMQLLFVQNFVFGPSMQLFNQVEGLMFYHLMLVMLSNMVLVVMGFMSQSKYSIIAVVSGMVHVVSLDIYMTVIYVLMMASTQSGNFHDFVMTQSNYWFLFTFSPLAFCFLMMMLVESKSAPFDHVETEAEVVAGYATEHSGIFLLIFYLTEYMHLMMSANHFSMFFLGGWSLSFFKSFLPEMFLSFNDSNYYHYLFF